MDKNAFLGQIRGGLIVSCQALPGEALRDSYIMGRMAAAAQQGGAVAIRANGPEDIREIKKNVTLPVIGLFKKEYHDSEVYITPTMEEVDALMETEPEAIALDATRRVRPGGMELPELVKRIRQKYPEVLLMADTSVFEEGEEALRLGFDIVATTLSGYTSYTRGTTLPDFALMRRYVEELSPMPVIAEGGVWSPEDMKTALELGVWAVVVGTAITRPTEITKRYAQAARLADRNGR